MIRVASLRTSTIGILTVVALCSAGCYGPARVHYIDSSRTSGSRSSDETLGDRANTSICGSVGPASVTTYASIGDRLIRIFTMQLKQPRHIETVCAKKED